jgi:hypothetical protein
MRVEAFMCIVPTYKYSIYVYTYNIIYMIACTHVACPDPSPLCACGVVGGYRGVHELWSGDLRRRLYLINAQHAPLAQSHKVG